MAILVLTNRQTLTFKCKICNSKKLNTAAIFMILKLRPLEFLGAYNGSEFSPRMETCGGALIALMCHQSLSKAPLQQCATI